MLHYDFGLMCESAIIDQQTNHLSIIKVIEGFNFKELPSSLPRIYFVTSWSKIEKYKQEQKSDVRVKLLGPDSQQTVGSQTEFEIVVPSDKKKLRGIIEITGLPIEKEGEHKIIIEAKERSNWIEVGYISFEVTSNPQPEEVVGLPKS